VRTEDVRRGHQRELSRITVVLLNMLAYEEFESSMLVPCIY
jgi:hypothetical protein